jgi:tRNA-guanine transglycosylase
MSEKKMDAPKKRKIEETASSSFSFDKPEVVQAEWLEVPSNLQGILDSKTVAWDKYDPYNTAKHLPLVSLDHPNPFSQSNDTSPSSESSPALYFHVHALCGRARAGTLHFPEGPPVTTPRFMPVGTKGTIKGILPEELGDSCPLLLANTYHLALQPGTDLIDQVFGGLPKFMGNSNKRRFQLLTDSGGFQMVSLAALSQVTEDAVVFESPYQDKKLITLRPEDSIRCQNEIGANIIMQLDDVISSTASDQKRFRLATLRTLRWYDRCRKAHKKPHLQSLYPITQGHLDTSPGGLREICLAGFQLRDKEERIPGFAIGGLAGGESKDKFWRVIDHACRHLPDDRPRYLMGVGYPLDLVVCTALGVDQYDCVFPTRTARFGVALVDGLGGTLRLKQHEFAVQRQVVLEEECPCQACSRKISRGRIHQLLKANNSLAVQLLTLHNVSYMMRLVLKMRTAIVKQEFPDFVRIFLKAHFGSLDAAPSWVVDALSAAGVDLSVTEKLEKCGNAS